MAFVIKNPYSYEGASYETYYLSNLNPLGFT